jgi:hypothetical protein
MMPQPNVSVLGENCYLCRMRPTDERRAGARDEGPAGPPVVRPVASGNDWAITEQICRAGAQERIALRTTDAPVCAIAFEAGFCDLSTFNNRFRDAFGTAPARFRKRAIALI